ncbi:MAG: hypothetical protein JXP34_03930 [Planctomycetes bacterium]|nr:hypothetical protein [Planctomycetota bacterium]
MLDLDDRPELFMPPAGVGEEVSLLPEVGGTTDPEAVGIGVADERALSCPEYLGETGFFTTRRGGEVLQDHPGPSRGKEAERKALSRK